MRYDNTCEIHNNVEGQCLRHREREHSHLSALKGDERPNGILLRIVGGLERLPSADSRGRRYVAGETRLLTDRICRMADGSVGRIAIQKESARCAG